jgi:hypothetical protein
VVLADNGEQPVVVLVDRKSLRYHGNLGQDTILAQLLQVYPKYQCNMYYTMKHNNENQATILLDMGITKKIWLSIYNFLLTGHIKDSELEVTQEACLVLGGIPSLNQYIRDRRESYNPQRPEDDIRNKYIWGVWLQSTEYPDEEWSVTCLTKNYQVWYRRQEKKGKIPPLTS